MSEHDQLIESLLAGEIFEHDDRAVAAFEASPELRERWRELRELAEELEGIGSIRDDVLDSAERDQGALRVDVRSAVGARDRQLVAKSRPLRRAWWFGFSAVAALLLVMWSLDFFGLGGSSPPITDPGHELGRPMTGLAPQGDVVGEFTFTWEPSAPADGYYVVTVYRGDEKIGQSDPLDEPSWTPTGAERREWAGKVRWRVEARGAGRNLESHGEAAMHYTHR